MSSTLLFDEEELEWEEWDGKGKFWHHCVAGSIAGVSEHTLMYPFDTVKTHLQACAECPHSTTTTTAAASTMTTTTTSSSTGTTKFPPTTTTRLPVGGMWTTMRHIVSQAGTSTTTTNTAELSACSTPVGMTRLWRGVHSIVVGCIPAHALYFSTYEITKHALCDSNQELSPQGAMAAGAAAAVSHDMIMTPLDTVKQRLQLNYYSGMMDAIGQIYKFEGMAGLFRSFPITLLTNIPYGAVMVSINEVMKQRLLLYRGKEHLDVSTCLLASSMGGMVAAATTTPLDRVKTFLQTQQLQPACNQGSCPQFMGKPPVTWQRALGIIIQKEGVAGLFKGMTPRVITHTPAVAISWTTYETVKMWLANHHY